MGKENKFLRWLGEVFNGTQLVALSFMLVILAGAFLFMLPISTQNGEGLTFLDAMFTATSATCVTGLTVIDVGNQLTWFGKMVLIVLIQIGGLGIMTMTTVVMVIAGRKVSLRERLLLQESMSQTEISGVVRIAINIIKYTVCIEFFFGTILALHFALVKDMGWLGVMYGYWHSVSAFCNAGFDLMGDYKSLIDYSGDVVVNLSIALLITLGGLGFMVLEDIKRAIKKKDLSWTKFALHTKIVLVSSVALNVIGTVLLWLFESDNPYTMGNMSLFDSWMAAFFQAVSARTAGFNTVDLMHLHDSSLFILIIWMFIGAGSGSTGGGIKTTTFVVLMASLWYMLKGQRDVVMFGRRIDEKIVDKSFVITVLCMLWVMCATMALLVINHENYPFVDILFEVVSGFGTVGLGIGITPDWAPFGKWILILTMYIGRIGILTFILSFLSTGNNKIRFPSEHINIG